MVINAFNSGNTTNTVESILALEYSEIKEFIENEKNPELLQQISEELEKKNKFELAHLALRKAMTLQKEIDGKNNEEKDIEEEQKIRGEKEKEEQNKKKLIKNLVEELNKPEGESDLLGGLEGIKEIQDLIDSDPEKAFTELLEVIRNNSQLIRKAYDSLRKDTTLSLDQKRAMLEEIRSQEEAFLKELRVLPNFENIKGELQKMKYTERRWFSTQKIENEKGVSGRAILLPSFAKNPNFRKRVRFNQMIQVFNQIEDSSTNLQDRDDKNLQAMNYFITKVVWRKGGSMRGEFNADIKNLVYELSGSVGSAKKFNERYQKVKTKFVDEIAKDMGSMGDAEKQAFIALQKRLDYYYQNVIVTHFGVRHINKDNLFDTSKEIK